MAAPAQNWDTHQNNNERVASLAGQSIPAIATLIGDLKQRGLLDRTLVLWMGEFGRTPKVNPNGGRDHFPRCLQRRPGRRGHPRRPGHRRSSPDGSEPKDRPVAVTDLLSTVCHALQIDPKKENMSPVGRPIKIVDGGTPVTELFG